MRYVCYAERDFMTSAALYETKQTTRFSFRCADLTVAYAAVAFATADAAAAAAAAA